jgi:hypothetical protein
MRNVTITITCLLALVAGASAAVSAHAAGDSATWRFRVLLDDREIGFHRFEVTDTGEGRRLETEASFDVRILFINAFRYRHRNVELWNGGCLERVDAVTDRNGERLAVFGEQREPGFAIVTTSGETTLPGCVASFAYWNPAILEARRLLNTQTGNYEDVSVNFAGDDRVRIGSVDIEAERYRLGTKAGDITLWYAKDDRRWLKLEAPAKGGRRLRYEPVDVPAPDYVDRLVADSGSSALR